MGGSVVQLNHGDKGAFRPDGAAGILPACPGGDHQDAAGPETACLPVVGTHLDLASQAEEDLAAGP